jgi:hypothetical protein
MYVCEGACKASWLAARALHENDASVVDTDGTGLNSAVAVSAGGVGGVVGVCSRVHIRLLEAGLAQRNVGDKDY